jgi:small subunit ribosomal protein S16
MAVRLRLARMGRKKRPFYRIVAADSRSPRDGRFIERLGYYDPMTEPPNLKVNLERVDYWLGEGASPSETVGSLISKARAAEEAQA